MVFDSAALRHSGNLPRSKQFLCLSPEAICVLPGGTLAMWFSKSCSIAEGAQRPRKWSTALLCFYWLSPYPTGCPNSQLVRVLSLSPTEHWDGTPKYETRQNLYQQRKCGRYTDQPKPLFLSSESSVRASQVRGVNTIKPRVSLRDQQQKSKPQLVLKEYGGILKEYEG